MTPWDAALHLFNFALPALGVGLIAAVLAKLLWRGDLRGVSLARLAGVSGVAGLVAQSAGLVITGHDGKMATYAAMVVACAIGLLWAGWGRR